MPTPPILIIRSQNEDATAAFARALAPALGPGDTILLDGPIGAGKTFFARWLIQTRLAAAGLREEVPSPTFTLVQTYWDGICEIWHADLYRLGGEADTAELGLESVFDNSICLVEWPEKLGASTPRDALTLRFSDGDAPDARDIAAYGNERWAETLATATRRRGRVSLD